MGWVGCLTIVAEPPLLPFHQRQVHLEARYSGAAPVAGAHLERRLADGACHRLPQCAIQNDGAICHPPAAAVSGEHWLGFGNSLYGYCAPVVGGDERDFMAVMSYRTQNASFNQIWATVIRTYPIYLPFVRK